jgi:hypothetical protein
LIAENPEGRSVAHFEQVLDEKPLTAKDRHAILEIVDSHAKQGGPFNANYLRLVLSDAGINPTDTNMRRSLPTLALARSEACLQLNRDLGDR